MKKLIISILLIVVAISAPMTMSAADEPGGKKENKAESKATFRPFRGTIKSVDAAGKTITLEGEKAQTFTITSATKISKNGKPATFSDLVKGDALGGRAQAAPDGKWTAVTINAGKRPANKPENQIKQ